MSVQVRRRREAASFLASFVGAQGELIVDTTNNRVQVHDGATPGGFAAAKLSEVVTNTRTAVADASCGALSSDRMIAYTAITAPRTVTLPAASSYPTGTPLLIVDESGASSGTNTITLARAGADLINGAASAAIASSFGFIAVESSGVSRWTIIDQSAGVAAATPLSVPVRQTVMGGPAAAGAPSFLPTSSASLTLTEQNVSPTTPLTLTAAQGYSASGALNVVNQFTANPSWASLAASTTCYLHVNVQTGATGFSTLLPIYQFGGAITVTSGQFTFDYQVMTGYLGNGTAAVATPLVFIGEAVTSSSAVTGTVAYAYNGFYDSGWTSTLPSGNVVTTKPANLGLPADTQRQAGIIFQNVTADLGYVAGDTLTQNTTYQTAGPIMTVLNPILTRNAIAFVATSGGFIVANKSTGAIGTMVNANWKYKLIVGRGW